MSHLPPASVMAAWRSQGFRYGIPGQILNANLNSTADQAFTLFASTYVIKEIWFGSASVTPDTAVGGIYTATAKGGTAIVAANTTYATLDGAFKYKSAALHADVQSVI